MSQEDLNEFDQEIVGSKKKKMTLEQFFQQFNTLDMNNYGGWPLSVKITCWIFVFLVVLALGYFVVIRGQLDDIANAQAQEQSLLNEFREKDSKLRNLQQYQAQLQEMEANFNQQLEQLPKETEIPSLVEDINLTGVNSGLKFKNIRLENEVKQEFFIEDRSIGDASKLESVANNFIKQLTKHKEVKTATQSLNTHTLELSILPNVELAAYYGVSLHDYYSALQTMYSNHNINFAYLMQGLIWVVLEADFPFRASIQNLNNVFVHSLKNDTMVPLATLSSVKYGLAASVVQHFNGYLASKVTIRVRDGYSMGDVMKVIDQEIGTLPKGYDYDWYGTSYMQRQSQSTSANAFVFSIIMIYLVLAALYEMWSLPWMVLLGIPCALFGSALILLLSGNINDLYFQISLIALLGLSAKNIILLAEFALQHFKLGNSAMDSAIHSLRLRFRPIVMTSLTFIFGTLPLVFASGAGANAQHSVGMGIIGGILGSVFIGTLLTPAFFVMIMKRREK